MKRNCNKYLAEKSKSASVTSNSDTLICNVTYIYLTDAPTISWVYDTTSLINIYNSLEGW
jgi:hypothetical protein